MSDLKPGLMILCGSRFALPAIYHLHQLKKVALVVCYSRTPEFEEELKLFCSRQQIRLELLEKNSWLKRLEELLLEVKPLAVLVKTFSFRIPSRLFVHAQKGFINFHYALLPQYRGAFPLYEVVKSQETYGGVTVHYLTEGLDEGPVIMQQYVPVKPGETYGKHELNLSDEGARLALILTGMLEDESAILPSVEQDESLARVVSKPGAADILIRWNEQRADQIIALIVATNPWGKGALAYWMNTQVQILYARSAGGSAAVALPGEILELSEAQGLRVACINGESIWIDVIWLPDGYVPGFKLKDYGIQKGDIAFIPQGY